MEFNEYLLKDIATIIMGQSPKSEYYSDVNGTPFLQGNRTFNNLYPTIDTYTTKITKTAEKNDILFSVRAPVGEVNIAPFELCIGRGLSAIRSKNKDNKFLHYLLIYKLQDIHSKSTGTIFNSINKSTLENLEIKIPNEKFQKFIGTLLRNIDNKIELNNKIIANLEELSQILFKRWFVDFEFPDEDGNPYKSSGGEMIDSELGKIPLNWNVNALKNIADIRTGYAFKSSEYIYSSKLSVLRTLNISKTSCLIEMSNLKFVSNDYINIPKYNKYSLEIFDTLLVTVGGSIGNIGIITESNLPSLQNQNMWRFRTLNSKINNPLIYNIIKIINKNVSNQTSGSAREFYTKKVFENFKIALPNLNHPMLLKANQIHLNLFKNISNLNKETNNLVKLRDTLLPKLMSGELEISDDVEVNEDELSI
ncbi:restriction endonuclease subunit S [Staphylococcus hominis]|uniref:restriction endonuclease subunit S n=1 Tax=Staphylococcus hominis TaxID=1290 RepID=UPI001F563B9D|nr:restriction endonuclease subunit S [Staphylococcus hominis]MCI2869167.1 restriction endonuclease subunit S [Staphylococcus hominis]MDS3893504.1 restriction endonuclease subunit S [Staphylococcus hominis]